MSASAGERFPTPTDCVVVDRIMAKTVPSAKRKGRNEQICSYQDADGFTFGISAFSTSMTALLTVYDAVMGHEPIAQ